MSLKLIRAEPEFGYGRAMSESGSPKTLTREQVRELDRRAIEEYGIPSALLMENAGRACAEVAEEMLERRKGARCVVLCGPGNNGGDGFVIARTLQNRGYEVELFFAAKIGKLSLASEDVQLNAGLWRRLGGEIVELATPEQLPQAALRMRSADLIVDALFGTGLDRELDSRFSELIYATRSAQRPLLAVDVPSGLDANSGAVLGEACRATVTVTFVAAKPGLFIERGPDLAGRIEVAEIGIPAAFIRESFGDGR